MVKGGRVKTSIISVEPEDNLFWLSIELTPEMGSNTHST